jgi:hypothetical protein
MILNKLINLALIAKYFNRQKGRKNWDFGELFLLQV